MKVILNDDVKHLGEMGDIKTVANGYARNYLLPRSLALPYNDVTAAWFETRKEEIEARKQAKRADSASLKEKLAAHTLTLVMAAGPNGKLYGALSAQTIADALAKDGFDIERKRIEVPGVTVKTVGKYTVSVRLYEAETVEFPVIVEAQAEPEKTVSEKAGKTYKKEKRSFEYSKDEGAVSEHEDAETSDNVHTGEKAVADTDGE